MTLQKYKYIRRRNVHKTAFWVILLGFTKWTETRFRAQSQNDPQIKTAKEAQNTNILKRDLKVKPSTIFRALAYIFTFIVKRDPFININDIVCTLKVTFWCPNKSNLEWFVLSSKHKNDVCKGDYAFTGYELYFLFSLYKWTPQNLFYDKRQAVRKARIKPFTVRRLSKSTQSAWENGTRHNLCYDVNSGRLRFT